MVNKLRAYIQSIIRDEQVVFSAVLVIMAVILGTVVRLNFISGTDFPVNDGGLFYQMVEDLIDNNFHLPMFTAYNLDQIPFAYPPLAFYLIGFIKSLTGISLFSLLRYVPVLISVSTIIAFYSLARTVISDDLLPAIAALFFALIPRTFEWFVMGGGITRSLGFLFATLAIQSIWAMYLGRKGHSVIMRTALFSGLTVLSHPETALFVVFCAVVMLLYHGISKDRIWKSMAVAAGVLVIISPWITAVALNHGLAPFTSAGGTGHSLWFEIKNLLTLKFGFENGEFLSIFSGLTLIAVISRKDKLTWLLFGILIFGYLLFPRSGPNILTIWVGLLAALGFFELVGLASGRPDGERDLAQNLAENGKSKAVFVLVIMYMFLGAYTYKYIYGKAQLHITDEIQAAFEFLGENSDKDDLFLIYPSIEDNRFWWNDYLSEWFPVLADRRSVTTVQGYEWVPDVFNKKIVSYIQLRSCEDTGPVCVRSWEIENGNQIDYLIIDTEDNRPDFANSFEMDANYDMFYDDGRLLVFKKK